MQILDPLIERRRQRPLRERRSGAEPGRHAHAGHAETGDQSAGEKLPPIDLAAQQLPPPLLLQKIFLFFAPDHVCLLLPAHGRPVGPRISAHYTSFTTLGNVEAAGARAASGLAMDRRRSPPSRTCAPTGCGPTRSVQWRCNGLSTARQVDRCPRLLPPRFGGATVARAVREEPWICETEAEAYSDEVSALEARAARYGRRGRSSWYAPGPRVRPELDPARVRGLELLPGDDPGQHREVRGRQPGGQGRAHRLHLARLLRHDDAPLSGQHADRHHVLRRGLAAGLGAGRLAGADRGLFPGDRQVQGQGGELRRP